MVGKVAANLGMTFNLLQQPLPAGKYRVIPYLLINHEAIPAGLVESTGFERYQLNSNYLKLPFVRKGGEFEVR